MLNTLRTKIILSGLILSGIWGWVAAMSQGLPKLWCEILDRLTGQLFSSQILAM